MEDKLTILVTGATGFIGSHLVRALLEKGFEVQCLVRRKSSLDLFYDFKIKTVYGDLQSYSSLKKAVKGINGIYHLAAVRGRFGVPNEVYYKNNVEGTKNLIKASLDEELKFFIYCSTAGVIGPLRKPPADESFPYNPSNIYELTKALAEKVVLSYCRNEGFPGIIVRPEFVYGPGDLKTIKLFKFIKLLKILPIINGGDSTIHPTYIDDLVNAFLLCAEKRVGIGETYIIAGERFLTVRKFLDIILAVIGSNKIKIPFPKDLAFLAARIFEFFGKTLEFEPFLTCSAIKFLTENRGSDISKARKELGYAPTVTLDEGIERTFEWCQEKGYI